MSHDSSLHLFTPGTEPEALESEACTPKDGKKPFVSAGKRIHNELTYRGIDFLLNSAIGVAFAYWTTRTKSGEQYFGKPLESAFKTLLKPVLHTPEALEEGAKWGSMFTSIIVGGTTIIPPMIAMENKQNKKALVRKLDEKIYGKERVASDPRFQECYECIDNEPKKNFTTGMAARLIVLAPMITMTTLPNANKVAVKFLYNPIAKASKALCNSLGIAPKGLMERGRTELADGDLKAAPRFVSDWDFIHRTIGFDLGLTFIYSFAHEAAYKTLAAIGFKKTQEEEAQAAAAPAPENAPREDAIAPSRTHVNRAPKSFRDFAAKPPEAEACTAL